MSALRDIGDIPDDQHPAVLLARAHELVREADELVEQAKAKRAESAVLRARAERFRDGEHLRPVRRKATPPDRLMAAAGLAMEDLGGVVTAGELAEVLEIREDRAGRILCALVDLGTVARVAGGYRAVDEEEGRVRDMLRELGTCTREELAGALEVPVAYLTHYVETGARVGWCHVSADDHLMYLRPDPSQGPREHETKRPPEKDPPAYSDVPRRGEAIRIVNHGDRGTRAGQANRHRIKQRDARHKKIQDARAERSQKGKAQAAVDQPASGASGGYSGKRNPRRKTKKKQ